MTISEDDESERQTDIEKLRTVELFIANIEGVLAAPALVSPQKPDMDKGKEQAESEVLSGPCLPELGYDDDEMLLSGVTCGHEFNTDIAGPSCHQGGASVCGMQEATCRIKKALQDLLDSGIRKRGIVWHL